MAEDRRVLDDRAVLGTKTIESSGDEGGERLGHGNIIEIAGRPVLPIDQDQALLRQEHADRLDRVERDAVRPTDDRIDRLAWQPGHKPGQQPLHLLGWQWLEIDRGERALAGTPVRSLVEQIRPGERDDGDCDAAAPLHEVVDEVEQALVGVMEILEHHDHRRGRGQPLEEGPPRGEQLRRRNAGLVAEERHER